MAQDVSSIVIRKGSCNILYAYDIGSSTNLTKCLERVSLLGGKTSLADSNRSSPKYFGYDPQPLTIKQISFVPKIGKHQVSPSVWLTFYDFGAVSICYEVPLSGNLEKLHDLSIEIGNTSTLLEDSRNRAQEIMRILGDAVENAYVAKPVEDYLIFEINEFDLFCQASELHSHVGPLLARILRAEPNELSKQEINDALAYTLSYSPNDITLIDWNAAMVFSPDTDDVHAVLEFANTELLELRFLDYQLDSSLDRSNELSSRAKGFLQFLSGWPSRNINSISQMQLEGAILFERVSNAPKLLGDQYLARVYRLASNRFHVSEWNSSILRKLDTMEDFYKQIHDRAATKRLETLEWIVIILIFIEIVMPVIPKLLSFFM